MIYGKKEVIILIYKILAEYTDEDHYLTQADIIDKLYQLYGVIVERKSVASSLEILQELDYDIVKNGRMGYALYSRMKLSILMMHYSHQNQLLESKQ